MPSRHIDISLQLSPHRGLPRVSVEGSALVTYDAFMSPEYDEPLVCINGIALTRAAVNDELLSEDELRQFAEDYEPDFRENIEWLALSSVP